jgi:AmmeMemoRadiSam system protein B
VACGGGPAIAVMLAARARGAREGRVLRYAHSGQISGDNSGVVGYLAAALGTFTDVH